MLGRLGFELTRCANMRQPSDVHIDAILAPDIATHLANGLEEWQGFYITNCATDLHQDDLCPGCFGDQPDPAFNFIGDMRNDLDRSAQVIAPALLAITSAYT